ncbi:MAG TPA: periplasmic heavy metal sensor [Bryobacteraceae bacterium]|nr:periplasmic heavy metal sensor [Dongiaceae bacterium]HVO97737.1 periplasmic heavy metal sensor [Bryobacteraceae bacterium]
MFRWLFLATVLPAALFAQGPLGGVCRTGRAVRDLNLSEAQQKQISGICRDNAKKIFDLREAWNKAEADLQAAFDESPVDQGKSNLAIERLAAARSELFIATSQMDLKIRTVLTGEQWLELKMREHRGPPGGPPPNGGWRRGGPPTKGTTITNQPPQNK